MMNIYESARSLQAIIIKEGLFEWAERLEQSLVGTTGSEIKDNLWVTLNDLMKLESTLSSNVKAKVLVLIEQLRPK